MKHKIAIYIPSLRGGGAERVMVTLANGFAKLGASVDLVVVKAEGPYLHEVSAGVNIVDLNSSRVISSLPKLITYLKRNRPQAMLSALNYANVVAVLAKILAGTGTRLVVSERANLSVSLRNSQNLRQRLVPFMMRMVYPRADGIVANSQGVADDLATTLGLDRSNIEVVYNPVQLSIIQDRGRDPLDHPWFFPDEPPVLISAGRFTEQKGFDVLLHAFARVRETRPARLILLGDGHLRSKLEGIVSGLGLGKDVLMPGFKDNPFAWVCRSRLFVFSSAWEGCPNVLLEALACGVPVVSTDCPSGPAEILENGRWGRLVPVGDSDAMASAIADALDDNDPPDVVTRAADFDERRAVQQFLQALKIEF